MKFISIVTQFSFDKDAMSISDSKYDVYEEASNDQNNLALLKDFLKLRNYPCTIAIKDVPDNLKTIAVELDLKDVVLSQEQFINWSDLTTAQKNKITNLLTNIN